MIKDSNLWWDGWDWAVVGTEVGVGARGFHYYGYYVLHDEWLRRPQFPLTDRLVLTASAATLQRSQAPRRCQATLEPEFPSPPAIFVNLLPANLGGRGRATLPDLPFPPIQTPAALESGSGIHRPAAEFGICQRADAPHRERHTMYGARVSGFSGLKTCQSGGAFAVRYFESMRQLPRRYR